MRLFARALLAASSFATLSVAAPALAQEAPAAAAPSGSEASTEVEGIVVTGSRIVRSDYSAQSPIVTVGQEAIQAAGPTTAENILNDLPQFAATAGSASALQASGGRANANLRGLGKSRTLVLLDGRRMQPSDPEGAVDLNTISASLIQGVEVITGGASAVYGSDAIAGVVNFQLKRSFEGIALDTQFGRTERGDGDTFDVALTMGGNFDEGRGNAVLNFSYLERDEILRGRRPFFRDGGIASVLGSGAIVADAGNLPSQAVVNDVFAAYGVAPGTALNSRTFSVNPDGSLFTTSSPIANFGWPDDGPYIVINNQVGQPIFYTYPLQQPMTRSTVFGRVRYDLTPDIEVYGQFNFAQYESRQNRYGRNQAGTRPVHIPITNPFLPDDMRTIMQSRPDPTAPLLIYFSQGRFAPDRYEQDYNVYQGLVGAKGNLDAIDGSWEVYASHGRTRQDELRSGTLDRDAYLSLVNAPDGGASICDGGLNPLVLDRPSQDCLNYLLRDLHENSLFTQTIAEATLQGRLFELPAGEARFAAGASYRKNEYEFNPDSQRVAGSVLGIAQTSPAGGSTSVAELFGEISAPLLRDLPFVRSLDLDLAYRYSDYDSIGGVHTYKASGAWEINDQFSLRGGYQRAIRAPAVGELFQPTEQGSSTVGRTAAGNGDPCDVTSIYRTGPGGANVRQLCLETGVPLTVIDTIRFNGSAVTSNISGNPDLKQEVADTVTAGFVWRSKLSNPWFSKLSASLDYYNIKVEDAIGVITGPVIVSRCFNGDGASNAGYDPNNYYCGLINRNPSGNFNTITTPLLNLAGYETSGVDLQVDWAVGVDVFGLDEAWGDLTVNMIVSYVDKYAIQSLAGAEFVNYAGTIGDTQITRETMSHPTWRVNTTVGYEVGPFNLDFRARWIDAMENSLNVGASNPTAPGVDSRWYFDLNSRYEINENVEARFGVLNLADEQPPEWTGEGATDVAVYDVLGRRYYMGVNIKF